MNIHKKILYVLLLVTSSIHINACNAGASNCASSNQCGCRDICTTNCFTNCHEGNVYGKTFFAARSQGDNSARKMMGVEDKIHLYDSCDIYGVASLAVEYDKAFDNIKDIGKYFSVNGQASMTYGVIDDAVDNGAFDINALDFGVTGSGVLSFCPSKSDIIADFNLYIGLDKFFCGLWARLDIPIVHTQWNLGLQENNVVAGSATFPDGLYAAPGAVVDAPYVNDAAPMTRAFIGGVVIGQLPSLKYGKINGKSRDTSIAGVRLDFGYDWIRRENWHLATSYDFVLPVGTKSSAEFLFDAMVGDSQRAQIGSTLNFAYELWQHCDATRSLTLYTDTTVTAYMPKYVQRLVGLQIPRVNRSQWVWSQYLPLKKFSNGTVVGLERAANVLTGDIKIGADLLVDIAAMVQFECRCFFGAVGYEFWYRSDEDATKVCLTIAPNTYAIKGVQAATDTLIAPNATINTVGTAQDISVGGYLTEDSIDYSPALHPSAFSNKLFGFVGYNWTECDWQPFVLIGGEVEFGQKNVAFSQWGILAKGGIAF